MTGSLNILKRTSPEPGIQIAIIYSHPHHKDKIRKQLIIKSYKRNNNSSNLLNFHHQVHNSAKKYVGN